MVHPEAERSGQQALPDGLELVSSSAAVARAVIVNAVHARAEHREQQRHGDGRGERTPTAADTHTRTAASIAPPRGAALGSAKKHTAA